MSDADKLYRKSAVERLSSPEQLDRLVVVTDPMGWLVLTTLIVFLVFSLGWGLFGSIPNNVTGQGILVAEGGRIYNAMAPARGTISKVHVQPNALVTRGDVLIELRQSGMQERLESVAATLEEKRAERTRTIDMNQQEMRLKLGNFAKQKRAQRELLEVTETRKSYLENILEKREEMLAGGLLSKQAVEDTRQQYNRVVQEIATANTRLLDLDAQELEIQTRHLTTLAKLDQEVAAGIRQLEEAKAQLNRATKVLSPATGKVTELRVTEESIVDSGAPLMSIASTGRSLQAVLYIPTKDGKKVRKGMKVRVEPASVRKEEFGTLIGEVLEVSEFPATTEGMQSTLQNSTLVQRFTAEGAPYTARVNLLLSDDTPSGYQWTSGVGPDLQVSPGTTLNATITVREVRPLTLVMPFLRNLL